MKRIQIVITLRALVGFCSSGSSLPSETTSSPGCNETDLLPRGSISANGTGMTNVLMVTTTMGMLNWIHSNTTNLRPAVPLHSEFVVGITGLEKRLLSPTSTGNLPNHRTAAAGNNLLSTRWELDPGGVVVRVVADNDGVVTGAPSEDATIANVVFNIADDGTLGDRSDREDISDDESGLLTAVDELTGVHALGGDEELVLLLVAEGMAEGDLGEGGAAAGVVDDVGDDALEVAVALAEVEAAEAGGALAVVGVGLEDGARTLTLSSDHTSHGG